MESKTCIKCGEVKPLSEFYKDKGKKDGHYGACKKCVLQLRKEYYSENRDKRLEYKKEYDSRPENRDKILEYQKEYRSENRDKLSEYMKDYNSKQENKDRKKCLELQRSYGITLDEYNEMSHNQKGCCAICGKHVLETGTLCVDHNHDTGAVRGLLCNNCNKGIGFLGDNLDRLRRATEYLEKYDE